MLKRHSYGTRGSTSSGESEVSDEETNAGNGVGHQTYEPKEYETYSGEKGKWKDKSYDNLF